MQREEKKQSPPRSTWLYSADNAVFVARRTVSKASGWILLLMALAPILQQLALLSYAFEASLYLGRWPSYNNPDPKQLGWWLQHDLLLLGFVFSLVLPVLATGLALIYRKSLRRLPAWIIIVTGVLSLVIGITYARMDPLGVTEWFMD